MLPPRTSEETHNIISKNKDRSPIFNGQIAAQGPRYCPSIEDKVFNYPMRKSHHVFIEPESLEGNTIYPNGVSTSLPKDVQDCFYKTIKGLEDCKFEAYGYAVEYDVLDTTKLTLGLEHKKIQGLYFAGQINGTSGYEEAAGQGLIAGINASFSLLERELFVLNRQESYIGVMVEDLVTQKRDEPYRLFTARAENRLYMREDNIVQRMAPYRALMGLNQSIDNFQMDFIRDLEKLSTYMKRFFYKGTEGERKRFIARNYGSFKESISLNELVKRSFLDPVEVLNHELNYFKLSFNSWL